MAAAFVAGTLTFFQQSSAPTGWTKQVLNDDYTLRVTTGATGGNASNTRLFSTTMADSTFPLTVGSISSGITSADADLPTHTHNYPLLYANGAGPVLLNPTNTGVQQLTAAASAVPAGLVLSPGPSPHTHGLANPITPPLTAGPAQLAVRYVDFILASKN
jgi:hypothetical protein